MQGGEKGGSREVFKAHLPCHSPFIQRGFLKFREVRAPNETWLCNRLTRCVKKALVKCHFQTRKVPFLDTKSAGLRHANWHFVTSESSPSLLRANSQSSPSRLPVFSEQTPRLPHPLTGLLEPFTNLSGSGK